MKLLVFRSFGWSNKELFRQFSENLRVDGGIKIKNNRGIHSGNLGVIESLQCILGRHFYKMR